MKDLGDVSPAGFQRLRWAVALTIVAVILSVALLIKETAYLFTAFMFLGPTLLLVAIVLLVWTILDELKTKRVL
ncbi:MAG TPA: hypothetical protein VKG23_00965 [Thermoanaerobaculia bacterium]|nr:hypothetical protein [Thermoanaerobaculia bacterium]